MGATLLAWSQASQALTGLAATFGLVALIAWVLYAKLPPVLPVASRMAFLAHANELRNRLLRVLALLGFWITLFLTVRFERVATPWGVVPSPVPDLYHNAAADVYRAVAVHFVPEGVSLFISSPTEAVVIQLEVALALGVLIILPFWAFETWAFLRPALADREATFLARTVPAALALFAAGAAFGVLVMTPLLLHVLYAFAAPLGAVQFLGADALVGTVATMGLLFGVAFQLPVVMVALVRFGFLAPQAYLRYWRHWTLGIFVVAAIVTDPTLLSQLIVGTVLLLIYWGGVAASFLVASRRASAQPNRARAS